MRTLILCLALVGVTISALSLQVHYSTATQPCSINTHWDCGVVNHSSYAVILRIPVAVIGIAGYLVLAALAFMDWRFPLFLTTLGGLGFALRLSFIEEYVLQVWCLYCVISQCIIALIALLSLSWLLAEYIALRRAH